MIELWRAARRLHADLSGAGGLHGSGRWHSEGRPVVYLAENPALCLLEVRVNLDLPRDLIPEDYELLQVLAPDALPMPECPLSAHDPYARAYGDAWLAERRSALLRVPSAVAPKSFNVLLNPQHPEAGEVKLVSATPFAFDARLFN